MRAGPLSFQANDHRAQIPMAGKERQYWKEQTELETRHPIKHSTTQEEVSNGRFNQAVAAEESEEESVAGVMSLALATEYVSKSIFNLVEDSPDINPKDCDDDPTPTFCFMAKGANVSSRATYFNTSSDDDSECESKPSYKKLAKIATEQQYAMEKIQKLLDRSDDLLDEEMDCS